MRQAGGKSCSAGRLVRPDPRRGFPIKLIKASEKQRKKTGLWLYPIESRGSFFLFCSIAVIFFLANLAIDGPVYQADEGGYLANAAALMGFSVDVANSYYAGYSALLSPAFLLSENPETIYLFVKLINSMLWAATGVLVFKLMTIVFPSGNKRDLLLSTAISLCYPAWVTMSGYAFPSSAIVFLFVLSAYYLTQMRIHGGVFWFLFSCSIAYLNFTHPTSLAIIVSAFIVSLIIANVRNEWLMCLFSLLTTLLLVLLYHYQFEPWLIQSMSFGDYPADTHYPSPIDTLYILVTPQGIFEYFTRLFGMITYLGLSTVGLVFIPGVYLASQLRSNARSFFGPLNFLIFYLALSLLGILAISALPIYLVEGVRLDHWMYGRYAEGLTILLLALGFQFWRRRYAMFSYAVVLIALILFCIGLPDRANNFNIINGLGLWQLHLLPFSSATDRPSNIVLQWGLLTLPLFWLMFQIKSKRSRSILLASVFAVTALLQIAYHLTLSRDYVLPKYQLAKAARGLYPDMHCVALHQDEWPSNDSPSVYAFYFHNAVFTRIKLENWQSKCDGPLLSNSLDIGESISGAVPLAFNRFDNLILWADEDRTTDIPSESLCLPSICIEYRSGQGFYSQLPQRSLRDRNPPADIHTSGKAGYLLYGPYSPIRAGKYVLELSGEAGQNSDQIIIDIVNASEGKRLAYFEGIGEGISPDPRVFFQESVSILEDVSSLEVRVFVTEEVELRITGYTLRLAQARP